MKQKRLLKRSGSAILAALLVSSTVVPISSVDVAAYSSMGQNSDFNGHLGIVGSMTRWGEVSDVPMNDNDGDGIYEGIFHILATDNMLIDDSIQFKVREDESWDNNWSVYEADYDRTYNSQTNCRIDKVIVKDSSGATAVKLFTVNAVDELPLTNVSVLTRTEVSVGSAIPMIGKAVGGTGPFTYAFYFKRSSNTKWKVLGTEFGTETTARLKPTASASYDIRIVVKDSTGKTAEKTFTVVVK